MIIVWEDARGENHRKEDDTMDKRNGDLGSFVIRVQHRQNNSWQGRVTWLDENKSENFRSVLELIHLIDDALGTDDEMASAWENEK